MIWAFLVVWTLLELMVRIFHGSSWYLKMIVIFMIRGGILVNVHNFFVSAYTLIFGYYISKEQYPCTPEWHLFSFKYSYWHICITHFRVLSFIYILQLKWHLQYQTHLVGPWSSHQSFTGTCHLLVPLQMVGWWMWPCRIDMQVQLSMMILWSFRF